ncbi:hypothetical protein BDN72DRAFT_289836 [Pluteus cervinus]|uniref:Uncharacterized protein n=1 Tax=Pluteus cervinus TaxID=181527 RepID=A0ACD3AEE3_9AGAR|nr:hypothetical protein BDN72DRAFT_289836 [Pluteus cervinus]
MIQEQVLTGGDMLKKFGSDKTENVTVLHQMLNSENFKINALQFPKELLPIENQAWDGITENPVSITSLGKFVGEFIGFITIGLVYYGGLYCQHQYFGLQRPTLGLQMPASGLIVSFFTTCVFAFFLSYSASSPSLPPTTITTTTIYNHPTTITTTIYNHPTTITTTNYNHPITVTTMNYDHSIIMTTTTHTTITTTICDYPTTMTTTTLTLATFIDTKTVTVTSSAHCNYSF